MQLKQLLTDDDAVSPVIGVILMVAITVILAAVIGTFVLGLGDQVSQTTPSASFQFNYNAGASDELEIAHNGGDTLQQSEVNVTITGATTAGSDDVNQTTNWGDFPGSSGSEISAGSSVTVSNSSVTDENGLDLSGATVRVVWQAAEGDSSAQLGQWSGPDA
jgi:flagellin-like protein